jgi:ribose transport system substrate-binding protein
MTHVHGARAVTVGCALTFRAAALGILLVLLSGCGSGADRDHAGTPEDPWVIGMSQCNLGEPWRVQMDADVRAAAEEHPNLRVIFKDAQNNSLTQRAQVEEFVEQGVDLIIISPKEAAPLTRPVAEAYRQGIPVIVLDREVQGDEYTTFIGADNVRIGRAAGRWIREALGGQGKIVELKGLMTSTPGQDRNQGFLEGLALDENPGLEIVFTGEMQWLEPNARREMESALATNPRIDAVYAHNDPGAHGAWLAARAAGREDEMLFVGIDALPHEGQQYVREGIMDATFLYPTGGAEAIETALAIFRGEEVPKTMVLGTRLFTQENVASGGQAIDVEDPS